MTQARILVADDDTGILNVLYLLLKRHFQQVDIEKDPRQIPYLLNNRRYDAIVLDMNFQRDLSNGEDGFFWLNKVLEIDPSAAVVFLTAYGDVDLAVRAIKSGATDFVLKPWENDKLISTLHAALETRQQRMEQQTKPESADKSTVKNGQPADLHFRSDKMRQLCASAGRVAATEANILILGESGTGKTRLAELIHQLSPRKDKPFVPVDLGALPETLLESELFGHVKGAFTDAKTSRTGRFEEAAGGTIFLDEIANLSLAAQAKLLSVLQSRTVTRIGSNQPQPVDARLICATNQQLPALVAEKAFRQDLYYRINTIELYIPPLRERPEDILPLAEYFLALFSKKYKHHVSGFQPELVRRLESYSWPGNIRELEHAVERAVILSENECLGIRDFQFPEPEESLATSAQIWEMERGHILRTLRGHYGNISETAKTLGLSRAALYRRLEKYGINL